MNIHINEILTIYDLLIKNKEIDEEHFMKLKKELKKKERKKKNKMKKIQVSETEE